jgi:hypothetical protein
MAMARMIIEKKEAIVIICCLVIIAIFAIIISIGGKDSDVTTVAPLKTTGTVPSIPQLTNIPFIWKLLTHFRPYFSTLTAAHLLKQLQL